MKVADSVFANRSSARSAQFLTSIGITLLQENVRVKEQALAFSQKLLADNKKQVEIGTLAPSRCAGGVRSCHRPAGLNRGPDQFTTARRVD